MPMPQRKGRPPNQLLCNNSSTNARYFGTGSAASNALASLVQHTTQNSQPPPITDTLTACLDVNGTYICTSYSPRCYIIQKVTPTSVTVMPHLPGTCLVQGGQTGPLTQPLGAGSLSGVSSVASASRSHTKYNMLPGLSRPSPLSTTTFSDDLASMYSVKRPSGSSGSSFSSTTKKHHYNNPSTDYSRSASRSCGSSSGNSLKQEHRSPSSASTSRSSSSPSFPESAKQTSATAGTECLARASSPTTGGRVLMNGEVASVFGPSGEVTMPSAGVAPNCGTLGPHLNDSRVANGLRDGGMIQREFAANSDMTESEHTEISTRPVYDPGHVVNSGTNMPISATNSTDSIPLAEKRRLLLHQLEYYFSPENLANDKFLVSQMDSDHYVYISTLANFNMVKKLTSDLDLITSVLRESKSVQVHQDGKRARPVIQRTVVILRGIPEKTPVEEIKALFENENCPKCNSCEFAFNDSWYISFESDEDAQQAHRYLREDVREFKGQPIMARIKSRPTTLLSQGINVHGMKNGYQVSSVMQPFTPFVPSAPNVPGGAVPANTMYTAGQQVPPIYQMPSYAGFSHQLPWPGFYDVQNPTLSSQIYINGIGPATQSNTGFPKNSSLAPRQRNPNQRMSGPRRLHALSNNETGGGGSGALGAGNSTSSHHQYNNQRKNNGAPPPLLGMPPVIPLVSQHASSHHHNHVHSSTALSVNANSATITQNGRHHYVNALPQPVPHNVQETFHQPSSSRYRADSRPRSSLGTRKGSRKDDDSNFDSNSPQSTPVVRNNPSSRTTAPQPVASPQPAGAPIDPAHLGQMKFDLASTAFPPLPGAINASHSNEDSPYEDRLADVVKGVKNAKISPSSSNAGEKDETGPLGSVSNDTVVTSADVVESMQLSGTSLKVEVEEAKKEQSSSQSTTNESQKNFRDIGVGSADDVQEVRSTQCNADSVAKSKETADKSTLIESSLLIGDQPSLQSAAHSSIGSSSKPIQNAVTHSAVVQRKSAHQSNGAQSPAAKRAVPAFHGSVSSSSVAAGPTEVPYTSKNTPMSSPLKNTGNAHQSNGSKGASSVVSLRGTSNGASTGPKLQDTGRNFVSQSNIQNTNSSNGSLNTSDKEAFPTPVFAKPVPTTPKSSSVPTDNSIKENVPKKMIGVEDSEKEKTHDPNKKSDDSHCSIDDKDGPVKLSYAQVAQSRKDTQSVATLIPTQSGANASTIQQITNPNPTGVSPPYQEDKRKSPKESKEVRPTSKHGRSNITGVSNREQDKEKPDKDRDRERDRPFRRDRTRHYVKRLKSDGRFRERDRTQER